MTNKIKVYKKDYDYSYTSGAYATIELLNTKPEIVEAVYIHSAYQDKAALERRCADCSVPYVYDDKCFLQVNQKENSFVIGVFRKYDSSLSAERPHIVLVNPSDMGNLGTIIRTAAALSYRDLAIIAPAADVWHPKTIRASMGALFRINFKCYDSFEAYRAEFQEHELYPFMLGCGRFLSFESCPQTHLFSLIFGNEATGLHPRFQTVGTAMEIRQSGAVDSFNLTAAAAIAAYTFALKNKL
jgi:TrmH family RNA methyltransferase